MTTRSATAMLLALVAGSCADRHAPFSARRMEVALAAAAAVDTSDVEPAVKEVYEARIADPTRDAETFADRCGAPVPCVYSRAATAAWIRSYLAARVPSATVTEHTRADGGFVTTNIIADVRGTTRPDEWVLAVAHYDAWFGGAVDNATGVVVTLKALATLATRPLDRSVRALLVDGEELGMVGTGRYVETYGTAGVVMVLNADSVAFTPDEGGFFTHEPPSVEYWVQTSERSAPEAYAMADLARRLPQPLEQKPLVFPGEGVSVLGFATGFDRSDHAQFWLAKAPALFPFPAGDKPAFYHTADDAPDKAGADRLARVARLWAATLAAFATEDR